MATVQTMIQLQDRVSAPMNHILNALNHTVSAFEAVQRVGSGDIDTTAIEQARAEINAATAALVEMNEAASGMNLPVSGAAAATPAAMPLPVVPTVGGDTLDVPERMQVDVTPVVTDQVQLDVPESIQVPVTPVVPDPLVDTPAPVEVPIVWQTPERVEIFDGAGTERLTAELSSLQQMTERVAAGQQQISTTAAGMEILPPGAAEDIATTNEYIQTLMNKLQGFQEINLDALSSADVSRLNADVERTREILAGIMNTQNGVNEALERADVSGVNGGFIQLNNIAEQLHRTIRADTEALNQMNNVQWSSNQMELFTNTGVERFQSEIQSANTMLQTLSTTQQRIAAQAGNTAIFPANMGTDMTNMNARIQGIQTALQRIENNPINRVVGGRANAELERLRSQLYQALQDQNMMNDAMQDMDISAANAAYDRLAQTIQQTEGYIRDNVDEQGNFTDAVQNSTNQANSLLGKLGAMVAVYASIRTADKVLDLSDELTQTTARLNMMNDGLQTTAQLQQMIFQSAQNSRGAYQQTAAAVSKMGIMAKDAFSSNQELIAFAEQLNKQFTIAGTSTQGIDAAMLQLTQAMGSGVLRGEELNSVFEQAPTIIQTIADYLDVPIGQIRAMAQEGEITADIVKSALLSAAEETNAKFEAMPMTFAQVGTKFKNTALIAFQPIFDRLSALANSDEFNVMVEKAISALVILANVTLDIFDAIGGIAGWVYDNWSVLEPVITGIAVALGLYTAALIANNTIQGISNAIKAIAAFQAKVHAASLAMEAGATFGATAAQYGFNAALFACPIVWIIAALIALIVLFVIFTEEIMGAIYWLGALFTNVGLWIANCGVAAWEVIKNIGLWFANLGLSIWQVLKNIGLWFGNLGQAIWAVIQNVGLWFANLGLGIWAVIKACANNIGVAFSNAWIAVQVGFWSMVNVIMQGLKEIAEFANRVLGRMGVNIDTSGLDFAANKIEQLNNSYGEFQDVGAAWAEASHTYEYKDVGAAMDTYDYGSIADAWNTNDLDWSKVGEGFNTFDVFQDGWGSDAYEAGAEVGAGISDWIDNNLSMNALLEKFGMSSPEELDAAGIDYSGYLNDIDDIANDVGGISDSLACTEEDLKYLRDIAERDVINRFTTAELKVEFTANSTIKSDLDLDGIVSQLEEKVNEALESAAEGVHE